MSVTSLFGGTTKEFRHRPLRSWDAVGIVMVEQWYRRTMRVTIDKAGRVVIPKVFRQQLGLRADSELEIVADGGGLRLEPADRTPRTIDDGDGLARLTRVDHGSFTDADVAAIRDAIQR